MAHEAGITGGGDAAPQGKSRLSPKSHKLDMTPSPEEPRRRRRSSRHVSLPLANLVWTQQLRAVSHVRPSACRCRSKAQHAAAMTRVSTTVSDCLAGVALLWKDFMSQLAPHTASVSFASAQSVPHLVLFLVCR